MSGRIGDTLMESGKATAVTELSFEQALEELEGIVAALEGGEASLEESVDLYDRGAELRTHCEKKLAVAREKVEIVVGEEVRAFDGSGNGGSAGRGGKSP